jgi:hypothetical protein
LSVLAAWVILVVALAPLGAMLGDRIWWPSGPGGSARAIGEAPAPEAAPARAS